MSFDQQQPSDQDIRPIVSSRTSARGGLIFAAAAGLSAGLLFYTLENRRTKLEVAEITVPGSGNVGTIASPPPLAVPDFDPGMSWQQASTYGPPPENSRSVSSSLGPAPTSYAPARIPSEYSRPPFSLPGFPPAPVFPQNTGSAGPSVVFDATGKPEVEVANTGKGDERATAKQFKNPATTIPKGTVIQAVLETALDSTRAGFARAIVSRDVFSFDGSRVLVPKGSRLVGDYKADLELGQRRALIQWQRLMRPDGAVINLDSPSADPLGRAGVEGKVSSHFLQRFSGTILQSALDVGVQLATQKVSRDAVILALPGSAQNGASIGPDKILPTLKIRQGTSVSVFVSRDLDFSTVGPG